MFISSNYIYHSMKVENKEVVNPISSISFNLDMNNRPKEHKNKKSNHSSFKEILDKEIKNNSNS